MGGGDAYCERSMLPMPGIFTLVGIAAGTGAPRPVVTTVPALLMLYAGISYPQLSG